MHARTTSIAFVALLAGGCVQNAPGEVGEYTSGSDSEGSDSSSTQGGDGANDGAGTDESGSDTGSEEESGEDGGVRFDVPDGETGEPMAGCEKVDFLFVVDRSSSMADKQTLLTANFPGFISEIQNTLNAMDYHILVTDTDGPSMECYETCQEIPSLISCQNTPCGQHPEPGTCDAISGAGLTKSQSLTPCGIQGEQRYLLDDQPNLPDTFTCLATVGKGGDVDETQMQSVLDAVGVELNEPGECNEGFLRDDAILVVVLITDEDDKVTEGDISEWKEQLLAAKGDNEDAIVFLGLIGDVEADDPVCEPWGDVPLGGAEDAPKLRSFIESLSGGQWASVCEQDYSPFFLSAIEDIDIACDNFVPEG